MRPWRGRRAVPTTTGCGSCCKTACRRREPASLCAHLEGCEALWNREYQQRLFDWAAEQAKGLFQESTWRAFWMTAVEGKSGQEAAGALGITPAAVYLAKGRVMLRLRELTAEVEGE